MVIIIIINLKKYNNSSLQSLNLYLIISNLILKRFTLSLNCRDFDVGIFSI